jgi:hypothetical protein
MLAETLQCELGAGEAYQLSALTDDPDENVQVGCTPIPVKTTTGRSRKHTSIPTIEYSPVSANKGSDWEHKWSTQETSVRENVSKSGRDVRPKHVPYAPHNVNNDSNTVHCYNPEGSNRTKMTYTHSTGSRSKLSPAETVITMRDVSPCVSLEEYMDIRSKLNR